MHHAILMEFVIFGTTWRGTRETSHKYKQNNLFCHNKCGRSCEGGLLRASLSCGGSEPRVWVWRCRFSSIMQQQRACCAAMHGPATWQHGRTPRNNQLKHGHGKNYGNPLISPKILSDPTHVLHYEQQLLPSDLRQMVQAPLFHTLLCPPPLSIRAPLTSKVEISVCCSIVLCKYYLEVSKAISSCLSDLIFSTVCIYIPLDDHFTVQCCHAPIPPPTHTHTHTFLQCIYVQHFLYYTSIMHRWQRRQGQFGVRYPAWTHFALDVWRRGSNRCCVSRATACLVLSFFWIPPKKKIMV